MPTIDTETEIVSEYYFLITYITIELITGKLYNHFRAGVIQKISDINTYVISKSLDLSYSSLKEI